MTTALVRRRVADVRRAMRRALAQQDIARSEFRDGRYRLIYDPKRKKPARDPQHLIGRWALPNGAAFTVRWLDEPNGRALCSGSGKRRYSMIADLHAMLDRKQLRYLGRG